MSEHAVVAGNYADFKLIKSRSVAQLIIEISIESAEEAIQVFGVPQPGAEIRVAIARLVDPEPAKQSDKSQAAKAAYSAKPEGEQAVVRAAVLARDPRFQLYAKAANETEAADFIRRRCAVESRKEIASGGAPLDWFLIMETDFRQFSGLEATP